MACRHQSRRGSDPLRRWRKRRCERNRSDSTHVAANRAEVRQCQVAVTLRGSRSLRIGSPAVLPPSGCALTNDASVQCAGQFGVMGKAALHRSRGKMTPVVMRGSALYIPGVWLEHVVPRQRAFRSHADPGCGDRHAFCHKPLATFSRSRLPLRHCPGMINEGGGSQAPCPLATPLAAAMQLVSCDVQPAATIHSCRQKNCRSIAVLASFGAIHPSLSCSPLKGFDSVLTNWRHR
jgi:hypothetical protein